MNRKRTLNVITTALLAGIVTVSGMVVSQTSASAGSDWAGSSWATSAGIKF